jgi:transcription elongation factor Elf1
MSAELPPFRCPKCDVIMLITSVESKDGKYLVHYVCSPCGTHEVKVVNDPVNPPKK